MPTTRLLAQKSRFDLLASATGVISEPYPANLVGNTVAPATQTVYGVLLGLRAGDVVTGLAIRNSTAASGTAPTTGRFGLADSTGKILVLSANINAAASWGTGAVAMPFTAAYTVLADGGYFACYVVNGTWSVTQPTPALQPPTGNATLMTALGSAVPPNFSWTGQTDLPAVGASMTITAGSTRAYWIAAY